MWIDDRKQFEINFSTLNNLTDNQNLSDCRDFSRNDIAKNLNKINSNLEPTQVIELKPDDKFCFLIRRIKDTAKSEQGPIAPKLYFDSLAENTRSFMAFSTITERNISRYYSDIPCVFAYNINPEDIVHIFPIDSFSCLDANYEPRITPLPSTWLTLNELNNFTEKFGVFNQVTCYAKQNGNPLKPSAIIVFDKINDDAIELSKIYKLPIIITHPNKDAINYVGDVVRNNPIDTDNFYDIFMEHFKNRVKHPEDLNILKSVASGVALLCTKMIPASSFHFSCEEDDDIFYYCDHEDDDRLVQPFWVKTYIEEWLRVLDEYESHIKEKFCFKDKICKTDEHGFFIADFIKKTNESMKLKSFKDSTELFEIWESMDK